MEENTKLPESNNFEKAPDNAQIKNEQSMQPNIASALAYLAGPISGIIILVVEKKNEIVRFHALQSIILFGGLWIINVITTRFLFYVFFLSWIVKGFVGIINLAGFFLWLMLMLKTYQGEKIVLPYIGQLAEENKNLLK